MNPMLEKLMKLKKGKKEMPEEEVAGKAAAIKSFGDIARESMGKKIDGLKKVTVASNSPDGLKDGLEKARELLAGKKSHEMEESPEEEAHESPEEESAEDVMEHDEEAPGHSEEDSLEHEKEEDEHMTIHEIDAKILELMALKKEKEAQA